MHYCIKEYVGYGIRLCYDNRTIGRTGGSRRAGRIRAAGSGRESYGLRFSSIPVIHLLVQHLDDKGVVEHLVADRRFGAVAGVDADLLAQRNQLVEDRAHDVCRKVANTDDR